MPSLGVSSLAFDRVVRTTRSFFEHAVANCEVFRRQRRFHEILVRPRHQRGAEPGKIIGECVKYGRFLETTLVHVEAAVDFHLQGMKPSRRPSATLGDAAARIWLVVSDPVA